MKNGKKGKKGTNGKKGKKGKNGKNGASAARVSEPVVTPVHDVAARVTAKLFWNGRSQAVRLPKEFRFEGHAVRIRREGHRVILEPLVRRDWSPGFWEKMGKVGEDFERAVMENRLRVQLRIPDFDAPE